MPIPEESPTGFHALYWTRSDFEDGRPGRRRPILGWDESGEPLTVDEHGKRVAASSLPDFHSVVQRPRILAALPGAGWGVAWNVSPEGDQTAIAPVISWVVYSDGAVLPVADVIGGGHLQPLDLTDGDLRLIPPIDSAG
ncbi:hypothetical protein KQY30_24820 [Streptomyces sp. GMY02]|uniref:hypothetical protein n=1 Tax=Streptomyces sp. GMY02 TaxID=1333528 RepID=UPI001C2B88C5|nr:hypothetical protein [Streptomyces sp. GMY02]QXE36951.1 hypothetical protein KQY30_24820 [Streptomyces sp. GMY02]